MSKSEISEKLKKKRAEAKRFCLNVDWSTYDYTRHPGVDMTFPDFNDDPEDRPIWIPKHYNDTRGMQCVHVPDLNLIDDGKTRRLYALYGHPVEWTLTDENEDELKKRIELIEAAQAKGEDEFMEVLSAFGLINEEHFNWMKAKVAGDRESINLYVHDFINVKLEDLKKEREALRQGELKDEFTPVNGISLEVWAGAMARIAQGTNIDKVISDIELERPEWDTISAEWNTRMARDSTFTISTIYSQAFSGSGGGQYAEAGSMAASAMDVGGKIEGEDPISFEKWIEITEAQSAAASKGIDANIVLKSFAMNAADWSNISAYWAQKFNSNAMNMLEDFTKLSEKYREKFASWSFNPN